MADETIWISGGTGLVGGRLVDRLLARGARARLLTRRPESLRGREGVEAVGWDGRSVPPASLEGADAAVHLSGEPVFGGLPTRRRLARIRDSRIDSTRSLVEALAALPPERRPASLICASAVGYYGDRGDEELGEEAPPGSGLLAELCRDWEAEARRAEEHGVRCVCLRIGIVLAREGGALSLMAPIFRLGAGGRLGSGEQWFPWIHVDDLVTLILAGLDSPELRGPLNAVAPNPVRNRELTRTLGRILGRPTLLPAPAFALRAALGELSGELLASRRVSAARAEKLGVAWRHSRLESALEAELR